jgi:hypothetical protein
MEFIEAKNCSSNQEETGQLFDCQECFEEHFAGFNVRGREFMN